MHAYVGAHFVPIAVPEICCLMLQSNSKKLLLKTNPAMCKRASVGSFYYSRLSKGCLSAFNLTSCGILGHNPTTSAVTNMAFSGTESVRFILLMTSVRLTFTHIGLKMTV